MMGRHVLTTQHLVDENDALIVHPQKFTGFNSSFYSNDCMNCEYDPVQ